jgi:predicted nucleic acid-binding protein
MKITKTQLRQIIQEEVNNMLKESGKPELVTKAEEELKASGYNRAQIAKAIFGKVRDLQSSEEEGDAAVEFLNKNRNVYTR